MLIEALRRIIEGAYYAMEHAGHLVNDAAMLYEQSIPVGEVFVATMKTSVADAAFSELLEIF
jgi:hypothetical protein